MDFQFSRNRRFTTCALRWDRVKWPLTLCSSFQFIMKREREGCGWVVKSLITCKSPKLGLWGKQIELPHDKTSKIACVPSEDSDQPGHPPILIRVIAVHMKKAWVLSYPFSAQWRLWSDWADAQADLSLCWAHSHFVGFIMKRLNYECLIISVYCIFSSPELTVSL